MNTTPCQEDDPTPHRLSGTVAWLLGRASRRASNSLQDQFLAHGLRKWHYAVLATLAEFGPASQADIVRRLGIDRSDLVAVLNDLEELRYVLRTPDPANRRSNRVTMTEQGTEALGRFDGFVRRTDEEILGDLTPAERTQLARLLERIVHPPQRH